MESRIGLSPEELITIFNRMYLEVWAKTREKVDWESAKISKQLAEGKEVDIASLLVELMEVVITAARDGTILAIYENNEKVVEDLRQAGIELPQRELTN
ncbi:MAG: hypothetical protein AB7S38_13615 [Vulcanimicrobiota bacterium]